MSNGLSRLLGAFVVLVASVSAAQVKAPAALVGVWKFESPEAFEQGLPKPDAANGIDAMQVRVIKAKMGRLRVHVRTDGRLELRDVHTPVPGTGQVVQADPLRIKLDVGMAEQVLPVVWKGADRIEVFDGEVTVALVRHKPESKASLSRFDSPPRLTGASLAMVGTWAPDFTSFLSDPALAKTPGVQEAMARMRDIRVEISREGQIHFYYLERHSFARGPSYVESQSAAGFVVKANLASAKSTAVTTLKISISKGQMTLDNPRAGKMTYTRTHAEPVGWPGTPLPAP